MFELIGRQALLAGAGGHLRSVAGEWFRVLGGRIHELSPDADNRHVVALWSGVHGLATLMSRRSAEAVTENEPDSNAVIEILVSGLLAQLALDPAKEHRP